MDGFPGFILQQIVTPIVALCKLQKLSVKIFVMIMFGLSWFLTNFFIGNKFGMRSGYAGINDVNFSQASLKNIAEKTPNYQLASSNNVDENAYKKKIIKIFGTEEPLSQNLSPKEIESRINSFFSYLDQQQYITPNKYFPGTKEQFEQIVKMLARQPPVVPRETDSISDVLKNVFYFYRVLGKERITLIKDILENESDIIEPLMNTFYSWSSSIDEHAKSELIQPSIKQLYVYACFFLETLGGRSYLFRRDSKVRFLALYYCVLTIDQSNIDGINSNGIDIRPYLKVILEDITYQKGLNYKNQYFIKLEILMKKI